MKVVFKAFLLTFLTCCYFNTVFEFCDAEKKANFENESHCYIHQDNSNSQIIISKLVQHFYFDFDNKYYFESCSPSASHYDNLISFKDYPPPKRQLFLQYSSFLI